MVVISSSIAQLIFFHSLFLLIVSTPILTSTPSPISKTNCEYMCGDVLVPYPFGFGPVGCFRPGFNVTCTAKKKLLISGNTSLNYNGDESTPSNPFVGNSTVLELSNISAVEQHQLIAYTPMASQCNYNATTMVVSSFDDGVPYLFSDSSNMFTVVGCDAFALISGYNDKDVFFLGVCDSYCVDQSNITDGLCDRTGCCQISIPRDLKNYTIYFAPGYDYNNDENPCNYAFLACEASFNFTACDVSYDFGKNNIQRAQVTLEWAIRDEKTCKDANANNESYACVSTNSECFDVPSGNGYICNCSQGYTGNPYLADGCQDINECEDTQKYPCSGTCKNTQGSYVCKNKFPLVAKLAIVIATGFVIIVVIIFFIVLSCLKKQHQKERDMFFKQNGGQILLEQLISKQVDTIHVFSKKELEKATDDFNNDTVIGHGGRGMVYKGTLDDNRVVAIKKSKVFGEDQKEEFVNEMIILSQINHRNVVKLLGCCLEVDVPMLVYEFVPKGSLFGNLHEKHTTSPLNLRTRLCIATESAEALAYLHSSISRSIVHGDVKSQNILIDDKFNAKVSDFGASQLVPLDEANFLQFFQGTLGYLDPECLLTRQLTDKSDVYSFGVVLVELITRKMAIYIDDLGQKKHLSLMFIEKMKENRLRDILDAQILEEGVMEIVQEITEIAKHCLSIKGEERPTMRDVAERLHSLMNKCKNHSRACNIVLEEEQSLPREPIMKNAADSDTTTSTSTDFNSMQIGIALNIEGGR